MSNWKKGVSGGQSVAPPGRKKSSRRKEFLQNSVLLSTWKEGLSAELSVSVYLEGRSV
jgi:hypothetical protein